MSFQEQIIADLDHVFHNPQEFTPETYVRYHNVEYCIPILIDSLVAEDRKQLRGDYADGVYMFQAVAYIPVKYLKHRPRKRKHIEIDDDTFTIADIKTENGEYILGLERLDE